MSCSGCELEFVPQQEIEVVTVKEGFVAADDSLKSVPCFHALIIVTGIAAFNRRSSLYLLSVSDYRLVTLVGLRRTKFAATTHS